MNKVIPNSNMIWLIFLSVLLILLSKIGSLSILYDITSGISFKLNTDSYHFFSDFNEDFEYLTNLRNIKEERDTFLEEVIKLKSVNTELQKQLNTVENIDIQLGFDLPYNIEPVRVIRVNEREYGEIVINKGKESGLEIGQVLIKEGYAIGEIIEVSKRYSIVRLIISPKSSVPAISMSTKTKGLAIGDINTGVKLIDILIDDVIEEGDMIITTGINSNYPYGLILGAVQSLEQIDSDVTKSATLANEVEFNTLNELFIILD